MVHSFFFGFAFLASVLLHEPQQISDFTLTDAVSGNSLSLSDYEEAKAIVVIFNSNYCPYAKLYDQRISKLIDAYSAKSIQFILVNPNNPAASPTDSRQALANKVEKMAWKVPYLMDYQQKVANMLNAHKTPEAYLLQKRGERYKILYRGAIDDNPQVAADVNRPYLRIALDAVLQNQPIVNDDTHPTGCMIKR
jgi:peroxiredoxin